MTTAQAHAETASAMYAAFVRSPAMPCPYARLHTTFLELREPADELGTREQLRTALQEFWSDGSVSVLAIMPRGTPDNHVAARTQAYWLRYHWHYLQLECKGRVSETQDEALQRNYRHWMSDVASFVGPRLRVGPADIMMTAFNPLYDCEHARYAPNVVLPVIRSRDLVNIHERQPDLSYRIAVQAKAKIVLSMLSSREGIRTSDIECEYPRWLMALTYYRDFITDVYTDSYRIEPRTLPRIAENRRMVKGALESTRFKASLRALAVMIRKNPDLPLLARILSENPAVSVFDIAKVIYGDTAGMYVMPPPPKVVA
jgi:hypothetical protein